MNYTEKKKDVRKKIAKKWYLHVGPQTRFGQVGDDGRSWNTGYWQLGSSTLWYPRYPGDDERSWNTGCWQMGLSTLSNLGYPFSDEQSWNSGDIRLTRSKNPSSLRLFDHYLHIFQYVDHGFMHWCRLINYPGYDLQNSGCWQLG